MRRDRSASPNRQVITVLTLTARFPNLVQPWLVNQLLEIEANGGRNRLLATNADTDVVPDAVVRHGLIERCEYLPVGKLNQLSQLFRALVSVDGLTRVARGLGRIPRVWSCKHLTLSQKLEALLMLPHLGVNGIDVVHSHSEIMGSRALAVVAALNVPFVVTFHGLPPVGVKPISEQARRRYTQFADAILLNTRFARRQYVSLGAPEEKIRILPQGLRLADFPFAQRLPEQNEPMEVLSVGRFHPDKGQEYTIKAVALLKERGRRTVLHLVGNGPTRPILESLASDLGVAESVHFYSKLSDSELRALYAQAHVFVLASVRSTDGFHEETQGVVLQEAQASGLIVVATATGGIPECIDDGVSGFLVKDRSAEAIADRLAAVDEDRGSWASWQKEGRRWVETRFAVDAIGRKTWEIYGELLERRTVAGDG